MATHGWEFVWWLVLMLTCEFSGAFRAFHCAAQPLHAPGGRVRTVPACPAPQEAADHCNALPECAAFVFGPHGRGNITVPLASFKGDDAGAPIDIAKSSLSTRSFVYVKQGRLLPVSSSEGTSPSSSLPPAAIAGGACWL